MKVLTFDINPLARWGARDGGPSVTLNMLPRFWTPRPSSPTSLRLSTGQAASCPRHVHFPLMRNLLQARLSCTTHAVRRIHQTSYEGYSISMTQNGNGTWVAAFGRYDGKPAAAGRARQPVTETKAEIAEVIALADAQIAIDDLTGEVC